jgi:hypothetical protein
VHRHFRGLLGVHSRYGLHTRAVTVYRDTLTVGFSHFVTSMTAPVASGWSGCRVGLAPTGKRRLSTAHAMSRLSRCKDDRVTRSGRIRGPFPHSHTVHAGKPMTVKVMKGTVLLRPGGCPEALLGAYEPEVFGRRLGRTAD